MFVFKAAVVGAGVMGGEIAQVIAAADIPVILKDVDQRFVDTGLEKAREVTQNQADRLVNKGKLTQEQGEAQVRRVLGNITSSGVKVMVLAVIVGIGSTLRRMDENSSPPAWPRCDGGLGRNSARHPGSASRPR